MQNSATAYKLSRQIDKQRTNIARAKRQVAYTETALKFGFATTWLLYFIFAMGFYVSDLFGLSTWLAANTQEYIAFGVFFVMAVLMAQTLSMIKHVFYEHRAEFKYGIMIVLAIGALGVFFELFNSSSQQQHIAFNAAEQSKTFSSIADTTITVGGAGDTSALATAQGNVAKWKELAKTCKKNCSTAASELAAAKAQVASIQASTTAAAATAATATGAAIKAKAETLQVIKEENHKPVFKFVRDTFGTTISTAVVIIALIVSAGFEFSHALLSRILGEKLDNLEAQNNALIDLEAGYMEISGKPVDSQDFDSLSKSSPTWKQTEAPAQPVRTSPTPRYNVADMPAMAFTATRKAAITAAETFGDDMIKAQHAHNAVYADVHNAIGKMTSPKNAPTSPNQTADQTAPVGENGATSPNQTAPVRTVEATRPHQSDRPATLSIDQTVRMISSRVRQQIDAGKVARELRPIRVACILAHDQISTSAALPSVDFDVLAADILANATTGFPEPDLTTRPAPPVPPHQTGLVKSDWSQKGLVENQPDLEAIKKQAEIDQLKQQLADQSAAIAAKAEADRQAAAREAAAKAAKEEADRKAAEAAERGSLTEAQVNLATQVLADAITAGQLGTAGAGLGHLKTAPILKAAGLPSSTPNLKALNKLAGKKLVESGLAANHRNPGNGNPLYVIA